MVRVDDEWDEDADTMDDDVAGDSDDSVCEVCEDLGKGSPGGRLEASMKAHLRKMERMIGVSSSMCLPMEEGVGTSVALY